MQAIDIGKKSIIITGAASGLGLAYANALAKRGARVMLNDVARDADGGFLIDKIRDEINGAGGTVFSNTNDISTKSGVRALVDQTIAQCNTIDGLIHNAGIYQDLSLRDTSEELWNQVMDVHLNSLYYLTKEVTPIMEKRNYGRLIFITSSVGMYGVYGNTAYGAAKMAVIGFMNSLSLELAQYDIKCNAISPLAATLYASNNIHEDMRKDFSSDAAAQLCSYLCSPSCRINGRVIIAGGGCFSSVGFMEGEVTYFDAKHISAENISTYIEQITDMKKGVYVSNIHKAAKKLFKAIYKGKQNNAKAENQDNWN